RPHRGGARGHRAHRNDGHSQELVDRHPRAHRPGAAPAPGGVGVPRDPLRALDQHRPRARAARDLRAALPVRQAVTRPVVAAVLAAVLLTAAPPDRLTAQDSQFSVRGLGVPGRWESVRARTAAGAYGSYTDRIGNDGAVADLRFAAAARLASWIAIGAGAHILSGSSRQTAQRVYDDTTFLGTTQTAVVRYDGFGISGSVALDPVRSVRIVGYARSDNRLR